MNGRRSVRENAPFLLITNILDDYKNRYIEAEAGQSGFRLNYNSLSNPD